MGSCGRNTHRERLPCALFCEQRPLPCRIAAAQTLMLCVRSERRRRQRDQLCADIVEWLVLAPSCHLRMLFLRVCPILFDLLSRKFFRQHFFVAVVRLAGKRDRLYGIRRLYPIFF